MLKPHSAVVLAFLPLSACISTPPSYLVQPADSTGPAPGPRYATVTAGVKNYQVVDPKDWRELNRQVGPTDAGEDRGEDSAAGARRGR